MGWSLKTTMRTAVGGAAVALLLAAPTPAEAHRAPRGRLAKAHVRSPRPPAIPHAWAPAHLDRQGRYVPGHWR